MSTENDDLRETLEAAFDADAKEQADAAPEGEQQELFEKEEQPIEAKQQEEGEAKPTETLDEQQQKKAKPEKDPKTGQFKKAEGEGKPTEPLKAKSPFERAPDSWKPELKAHWEKVPNEVRKEIYRREQEIVQTLQHTQAERRLASDFRTAVYPFEVFLRTENVHPIEAVRELFGQAAILRVGTPAQKAQLVADVVKQFNIPVNDLDSALVGETIPDEEGKLTRIIQQQLQPVNQFMRQVGQMRQQRAQQTDASIDSEIDAFADDPKNKYFYEVNNDMADIMEMAARQGVNVTLEQAYAKACKMSDRVQQMIAQENQAKRRAGSSLPSRGAPQGGGSGGGDSLHSDILSAWDSVANQ